MKVKVKFNVNNKVIHHWKSYSHQPLRWMLKPPTADVEEVEPGCNESESEC